MQRRGFLSHVQPTVFLASAGLILLFVLFAALFTETASSTFDVVQSYVSSAFGWFYILSATIFLAFVVWLAAGPYGHVRLGKPDSRPEFSDRAWFAMLFSAGMGIGLVYWGVAEPMFHYLTPPTAEPESLAAFREAMRYTYFHWGLHPWAIYIVIGLPLAYFHFRYDLPMTPRALFYPLLGERIYGPVGHAIDILTVFATLFGIATSLGLGVMQINTGLNLLTGLPEGVAYQLILIGVITAIATISVVSGLKGGIRRLSEINISIAALLMLFVLLAGPTVYVLETLVSSTGNYLQNLVTTSFWVNPDPEGTWQASWTIFYWGWWISWAPFVGIFIARISKGRTIREFITGVLIVPTLVTFLWFAVFGGTGIWMELHGGGGIAAATEQSSTLSLFAVLERLPLFTVTAIAATTVIVLFFVTSSDSGSLVVDMVTSGGNDDPPIPQRIFWAVTEGVVAAVLLLTGGLAALQTAAITTGFPMTILMLLVLWSLLRALRTDLRVGGPAVVPTHEQLRNGVAPGD